MPQLVLPLTVSRTSGARSAGLIANVWMWVCEDIRRQDELNAYRRVLFRFDSGATHSSISLATARDNNLTVPTKTVRVPVLTARGRQTGRVRDGIILVKFVGLEAYPLVLPCIFHDGRPAEVPPLLGLNTIRPQVGPRVQYTFKSAPSPDAVGGCLLIDLFPA